MMNLTNLKKVIVVQGYSNSGKTAILNDVCGKLMSSPINGHPLNPPKKVCRSGKDKCIAFANVKSQCVGVCTAGDTADWIVRAFLLAEYYQCDVLILAVSLSSRKNKRKTAEVAFNEIVAANSLTKILLFHQTMKSKGRKPGYVDAKIVASIISQV